MSTRSDYAYYQKLWQRAYYLEIVDKRTDAIVRSFAFSLPPEETSIRIRQRVNKKPTFGGLFVDDFGTDTAEISISGSTGNGQLKEIRYNNVSRYLDGRSEAELILNDIAQYKRSLRDYENYELILYDLSSYIPEYKESSASGQVVYPEHATAWIVILDEVSFSRDSGKPFWWNYSLSFTGIRPFGAKQYKFSGAYEPSFIEKIFSAIGRIREVSVTVRKSLAFSRELVNSILLVEELTDTIEAGVRDYYSIVQGSISSGLDGMNSAFDIMEFPADLTKDLMEAMLDARASYEEAFEIKRERWEQLVNTDWDEIRELSAAMYEMEKCVSEIRAEAKKAGATPRAEIVPKDIKGAMAVEVDGSDAETDIAILLTYGYKEIPATALTRLDNLAEDVYGDPDYADTIATFNGIRGDSDIVPGMMIKIPYLSYTPALRESEIYTTGEDIIWGTDIRLADNGDLSLSESGDYATVTGIENIGQAINLRLAESRGVRLRLETYGVRNATGQADPMSLSVYMHSIKETLVSDARIEDVSNFNLLQQKDALKLSYDIDLAAGRKMKFSMDL